MGDTLNNLRKWDEAVDAYKQAIKLNPRFLSMITPARWFAGGRVGELSEFRDEMLSDERIRVIHDFNLTMLVIVFLALKLKAVLAIFYGIVTIRGSVKYLPMKVIRLSLNRNVLC